MPSKLGESGSAAAVSKIVPEVPRSTGAAPVLAVVPAPREAGEQLDRSVVDSLTAHLAVLDSEGRIVAVNAAWREFAQANGAGDVEWIGRDYLDACRRARNADGRAVAEGLKALLRGELDEFRHVYPCHSPWEERWFVLRATRKPDEGPVGLVLLHTDITERYREKEQLALQAALLDELDAAVITTDESLEVVSWSRGAEELYGYSAREAIGRSVRDLIVPSRLDLDNFQTSSRGWRAVEEEMEMRRKDGTTFPALARTRLVDLGSDGRRLWLGISMDITERKAAEHALLSAGDHLRAITEHMADGLLTLDGRGAVNYLNRAAEEMLGWSLSELDGTLLHEIIHHPEGGAGAETMNGCAITRAWRDCEKVRVDDDVFVRRDGRSMPVAYTATPYESADGGVGCVVVFQDITARKLEETRVARELEKLGWLSRVKRALNEERFVLYEQPILDLRTREVTQRELLIRMLPDEGEGDGRPILPGSFLPVAEEFGFILEIDRWVVDCATRMAGGNRSVELNVSARTISDPSFIDYVRAAIERHRADPRRLVFEITETALVQDEAAARRFVEELHEIGCLIALDDFGTGYGGFTYLKQLPLDYVKIDREFVRDLRQNAASRNVVQAVVTLAEGFDLRTVAEGVEDEETLELLAGFGVDYVQGYHIGRPAPAGKETER